MGTSTQPLPLLGISWPGWGLASGPFNVCILKVENHAIVQMRTVRFKEVDDMLDLTQMEGCRAGLVPPASQKSLTLLVLPRSCTQRKGPLCQGQASRLKGGGGIPGGPCGVGRISAGRRQSGKFDPSRGHRESWSGRQKTQARPRRWLVIQEEPRLPVQVAHQPLGGRTSS